MFRARRPGDAADDVQLPQLYRRVPLPSPILALAQLFLRLDQAVADQHPMHRGATGSGLAPRWAGSWVIRRAPHRGCFRRSLQISAPRPRPGGGAGWSGAAATGRSAPARPPPGTASATSAATAARSRTARRPSRSGSRRAPRPPPGSGTPPAPRIQVPARDCREDPLRQPPYVLLDLTPVHLVPLVRHAGRHLAGRTLLTRTDLSSGVNSLPTLCHRRMSSRIAAHCSAWRTPSAMSYCGRHASRLVARSMRV